MYQIDLKSKDFHEAFFAHLLTFGWIGFELKVMLKISAYLISTLFVLKMFSSRFTGEKKIHKMNKNWQLKSNKSFVLLNLQRNIDR